MKVTIFLSLCLILFCAGQIMAMMPPDKMAERNLEAELILVGKVTGLGKMLLPSAEGLPSTPRDHFSMKILHVIKGYGTVKQGDEIRVLFRAAPDKQEKIQAMSQGVLQVNVEAGNRVVVYLDASKHEGFYTPLAEGASVIVLAE